MNTDTALRFLGWVALTHLWLYANDLFFTAIADAIHNHNEQIRRNALEELNGHMKESESESEDEEEQ